MLFRKSTLLHGPIFRQVCTKAYDRGDIRLQCTYCNLFNAEKEENERHICKLCFGDKTFEYLTAMTIKHMKINNYEAHFQYSSKECFYKSLLNFDFRLCPIHFHQTCFFIEMLEDWHTFEDFSGLIKGAIKLKYAMMIKEPIFYLYEEDFGTRFDKEETCILNATKKVKGFFELAEQIANSSGVQRDNLLNDIYKMSPYYPFLKFLDKDAI
ncbi:hypothetical protein ACQKP0_00525 [Heyndrickxia sp. NPDC080065]|uniref:hypothetical protein n=1 Tax=Heyndrickxia sp. NPDC080065 TaxID=3390568 RepID=UPI003D0093DA